MEPSESSSTPNSSSGKLRDGVELEIVQALTQMRDKLVEVSLALQDMLFELDKQRRHEIQQELESVLHRVMQPNDLGRHEGV